MIRDLFKLLVWICLGLLLLLLSIVALRQLGNLTTRLQQGADPASALNIVPNVPIDWPVETTWLPDDEDTGRRMEPLTRDLVETGYLRAWLQWDLSFDKGEPFGLKTYFSGPALESTAQAVTNLSASGLSMNQVDTSHKLRLHFYSADGSIVSFTDEQATIVQQISDEDGTIIHFEEITAVYDIVMFLVDGNWRVRHWLRKQEIPTPVIDRNLPPFPNDIVGMNYYPQATPWDDFWPNYDPAIIAADFSRMTALGINSIRIFIPYEQFGASRVEADNLDKLRDLLDQASVQKLRVVVTLFDFRGDYKLLLWPQANAHMRTIMTEFADHPAILLWDMKNEADLDYDTQPQPLVDNWLTHSIARAKLYDPDTPITIGWASPESAINLAHQVDVISFHYYGLASDLPNAYQTLRNAVPDKPIALTEFGLPTFNSIYPHGHTEKEQANYYADTRTALSQTDISGYMAWTLYDFSHVPNTVAGRWPWQRGPQRNMGIIDLDGNEKPAAAFLAADAQLSRQPIATYERFLKPFWVMVFLLPILLLLIWWTFAKRNLVFNKN